MKRFTRRIFTARLFFSDTAYIFVNIPNVISAMRNKAIGRQFMEKIMTVVTAVNGCSYCSWFHANQALASGLSEAEIKNMLNLQFHADSNDHELIGLLFAQHYAETDRNPTEEMYTKLRSFYGERTAEDIVLFIRLIYFGNLTGNTFDAFIARLQGQTIPDGNFIFELFFFILNFPFMGPLIPFAKKHR